MSFHRFPFRVLLLSGVLWMSPGSADGTGPVMNPQTEMMRDFGLLPETPSGKDPVRVRFEGSPVPVILQVGRERRLIFDQPFRLGLEPEVFDAFETDRYDRNLLIRPLRPLVTRARVQLADGRMIPLDLHGVTGSGSGNHPLEIVMADRKSDGAGDRKPGVPLSALTETASPGYIPLTRFAAQQLYAPARLRADRPEIRQVPIDREPVRLIRGAPVRTTPVAAWSAGGLHVTAIRIRNRRQQPIDLDPRRIVGNWRAAAFHHNRLPGDSETALYLISDRPFHQALGLFREPEPTDGSPRPGGME